jgi:hypothetical protein
MIAGRAGRMRVKRNRLAGKRDETPRRIVGTRVVADRSAARKNEK